MKIAITVAIKYWKKRYGPFSLHSTGIINIDPMHLSELCILRMLEGQGNIKTLSF